jgi:hypothetical protein
MLDVRHAVSPAGSARFNAARRRDAFVLSGILRAAEVIR